MKFIPFGVCHAGVGWVNAELGWGFNMGKRIDFNLTFAIPFRMMPIGVGVGWVM